MSGEEYYWCRGSRKVASEDGKHVYVEGGIPVRVAGNESSDCCLIFVNMS